MTLRQLIVAIAVTDAVVSACILALAALV